jgi:hypothetical protein
MKFINQNSVIIISLILSYAIIYTTGEHWPDMIYSLFDVRVDWSITKYKFPVAILALLIYPIIKWLKKSWTYRRKRISRY